MSPVSPADNYRRIRDELPPRVELVVAAKGRAPWDVADVIKAGARTIGQNYVQEAQKLLATLGEAAREAEWHMIGRLQRNKINTALPLFDVFQSVDSLRLARAINQRAEGPLRALLEVNVGGEQSKGGMPPEQVEDLLLALAGLENLHVEGLMTMEPFAEDPQKARPYFVRMRELFERVRYIEAPNVSMRVLSMGMSHSWRVAVEEGATMVRIGSAIFDSLR
jgi:pyridoxal phosphate enzyme (YggS family)